MTYYLEEHPNTELAQYGWPRAKVSGVVGVHTTESGVFPAGSDPGAENTARYISVRANHGSYHALADWDSRIKLVRPRYAAWADITNNTHAMSVSGAMNAARWRDLTPERAAGIVRNMGIAAAELVQDAMADGLLDSPTPARRITAQQAIDGSVPGFYGHGETNPGTRYDPGAHFDWDMFLATYANAIGGGINFQSTTTEPKEWDEMASMEDLANVLKRDDVLEEIAKRVHTRPLPYYIDGQDTGQATTLAAMVGNNDSNIITTRRVIAETVTATVRAIFNTAIDRAGGSLGGQTSLAAVLAYFDANVEGIVNEFKTNPGAGIDQAKVTAAIQAAADEALAGISITLTNKESK